MFTPGGKFLGDPPEMFTPGGKFFGDPPEMFIPGGKFGGLGPPLTLTPGGSLGPPLMLMPCGFGPPLTLIPNAESLSGTLFWTGGLCAWELAGAPPAPEDTEIPRRESLSMSLLRGFSSDLEICIPSPANLSIPADDSFEFGLWTCIELKNIVFYLR